MSPNFLVLAGCAFIPLIIAFGWFHPKVFGTAWRESVGMSEEEFSKPPKLYQFALDLLINFLLAFGVYVITVHQTHVLALTGPDPEAFKTGTAAAFMNEYGHNFLDFSHGVAHGILALVVFAIPFIASTAIWEKRGMKYVLVNGGYWLITLIIMACIIAKWGGVLVS